MNHKNVLIIPFPVGGMPKFIIKEGRRLIGNLEYNEIR